eukprot:Seg1244.1 transcript_id=Seg1244.1/GoldUCD/mRNA.D3Y31 product="Protein disulfide isomerase-like 2-2" protein_id=Seg1244.1/GoldUCD/D3Y31
MMMSLIAPSFLILSALNFCWSFEKAGDIRASVVSSENFEENVSVDKFGLVLFFAAWQDSCADSHKVMERLAERFQEREDVVIAKANIYNDMKLASKYDVEDYCKIKYFVKGSRVAEGYDGEHTFTDLSRLVESKLRIDMKQDFPKRPLIHLNDDNFERIVKDPTKDVMVYYHTQWCLKCKNLTQVMLKVAENFKNEPNCLLAMLDGQKSFDSAVKSKVGLYPTFMFFPKFDKDGEVYLPGKFDENWSEYNITKFLNINCDTSRTTGGFLDKTAGRLDELDVIARYFMRNLNRREKAIMETIQTVQKLPSYKKRIGDYYVKVMRKIATDGEDFLLEEIERTQKLIFGSTSLNNKDELTKRRNILRQFNNHKRDEL